MKYVIIYNDTTVINAFEYVAANAVVLPVGVYAMTCELDMARTALDALGVDYSYLDTLIQ